MFPLHPDPAIRESLVFIGHGAAPLGGFILFEMQQQAAMQLWRGKAKLPPYDEMVAWQQANAKFYDKKKAQMNTDSTYYPIFLPIGGFFTLLDKMAGTGISEHFSW
jgi:hypothetical protein